MRFILKISTLLFTILSCSNSPKCSDVHIGKFELTDAKNNHHTIIERGTKYQIETDKNNDATTKTSIKWINDCTYILTYLESSDEISIDSFIKEVKVEITKIEGRKVYFNTSDKTSEKNQSFYMTKID